MNKELVSRVVLDILKDAACFEGEVRPEDNLEQDLLLDRIDIFDVAMDIEEEFGIYFPEGVIERFEIAQDVIDYVYDKINGLLC